MWTSTSMRTTQSTSIAILMVIMSAVILLSPSDAVADDGRCDRRLKANVAPLLETDITGRAKLCISRDGVSGSMDVEHLQPGDAYTVWFVYFDDPSQCIGGGPGVCGEADFAGDKPLAVFGRYDSVVARRHGGEEFEGSVRDLRLSHGSQVWFLIFGHGPADRTDRSHLARQLLTPEDPLTGAPHLGNVVDGVLGKPAAVAVFTIP